MMEKTIKNKTAPNSSILKEIVKGSLAATLISLLLVLLFALLANIFKFNTSLAPTVNAVIKGVSVFIATLISIKSGELGFIKGFVIGLGFLVISTILFAILGGTFDFANILTDLLITCGSGMAAGIIAVNKGKK